MNENKYVYTFKIETKTFGDTRAIGFGFIVDDEWCGGRYFTINLYKYQINIGWFLEWR